MPQVPFTPQGVIQKRTELYALTDAQLLIQAQSIGANFRTWFEANFTLDQQQIDYLNVVPQNVLTSWGFELGAAVIGRRIVIMGSLPDEHRRTKETGFTSALATAFIPQRGNTPPQIIFTGNLTINYQTE